jgi:hypothetical protein
MRVTFYRLANGGFAPQSFARTDIPVDLNRDRSLLEDAYACIARALANDGMPQRKRFAFGAPRLDHGRVVLWDPNMTPPVVATLSCTTMRSVLGSSRPLPDEDCRRLVLGNQDLVNELAEEVFAQGRVENREHGLRVLEIGEAELRGAVNRFSMSILETAVQWGTGSLKSPSNPPSAGSRSGSPR